MKPQQRKDEETSENKPETPITAQPTPKPRRNVHLYCSCHSSRRQTSCRRSKRATSVAGWEQPAWPCLLDVFSDYVYLLFFFSFVELVIHTSCTMYVRKLGGSFREFSACSCLRPVQPLRVPIPASCRFTVVRTTVTSLYIVLVYPTLPLERV